MIGKRGFEFGFTWIFTILVGAVIIFLAVYATTQLISTGKQQSSAQVTEQVGIALNEIATSLEESKGQQIEFRDVTRIYNTCKTVGNFGKQILGTSTRSDIGDEWERPLTNKVFLDKYLFSSDIEEGKKFNIFVKQLDMPYKVSDLIYIYTDNYCFVNPPGEIEDEISGLGLKGINVTSSEKDCGERSVKVCFSGNGCDINVDVFSNIVSKNEGRVYYYGDALLYGAIFSEPDLYKCQLKRLMKRTGELAHLYRSKSEFLQGRGCSSGLVESLGQYSEVTKLKDSSEILSVGEFSDDIGRDNEKLSCKLF